jgi:hypothetical protein
MHPVPKDQQFGGETLPAVHGAKFSFFINALPAAASLRSLMFGAVALGIIQGQPE